MGIYPLVNIQKTMERSTMFLWVNPRTKWPFSIAMLNQQWTLQGHIYIHMYVCILLTVGIFEG